MYSDVVCDLASFLGEFLKANQLPNMSYDEAEDLKEKLIDMVYQMYYVVALSDARGPTYMYIPLKKMRRNSMFQALKMIYNTKINKSLTKREFRQYIKGVLRGLLDDIDSEYSYREVYTDIEVIEMLITVRKVIDFLNDTKSSYPTMNIWATKQYEKRMGIDNT
jgi:hypothetical protein